MELILNSGVKIKFDEFMKAWVGLLQSDLHELSTHAKYVVSNGNEHFVYRNYVKTLTYALSTGRAIEVIIGVAVNGRIHTFSEYHKTRLAALTRVQSLNKRYKSCQGIL